jgi:hypothetical protein
MISLDHEQTSSRPNAHPTTNDRLQRLCASALTYTHNVDRDAVSAYLNDFNNYWSALADLVEQALKE